MRLVFYYNTYLEATCLDLSVCKIKLILIQWPTRPLSVSVNLFDKWPCSDEHCLSFLWRSSQLHLKTVPSVRCAF